MTKDPGNAPPEEWSEPTSEEEADQFLQLLRQESTGGDEDGSSTPDQPSDGGMGGPGRG